MKVAAGMRLMSKATGAWRQRQHAGPVTASLPDSPAFIFRRFDRPHSPFIW